MSNLKREMIELIKNPEEVNNGGVPEFEKVWTVPFISYKTSRDAVRLFNEVIADAEVSEDDKVDEIGNFLTKNAFGEAFTKDELFERLPGPGFIEGKSAQEVLEGVLLFVAGGDQSSSTKKYLAERE